MTKDKSEAFFEVIPPHTILYCQTCTDQKTGKKGVGIFQITSEDASVTIPSELRSFPVVSISLKFSLYSRSNIKELHLPRTLTSLKIPGEKFPLLEKVDIEPGGVFASADQMLFSEDFSVLSFVPAGYAHKTLRIPRSVQKVEDEVLSSIAFADIIFENPKVKLGKISNPQGLYFETKSALFEGGFLKQLYRDLDLLTIPQGITGIMENAFGEYDFTRLKAPFLPTDADLGYKVAIIHENLVEFELTDPDYDISLEDLRKYEGLSCIKVSATKSRYETEDGVLYDKERKRLLFYPRQKETEHFTVREGTTSIAPFAFWGCMHLVSLTLPDSVTDIGEQCICYCNNLESIWLSNEIQVLPNFTYGSGGVGVLSNNNKLTTLHLPEKLKFIGFNCIQNTAISKIILPERLSYLYYYALSRKDLKEISLPRSLQFANIGSLLHVGKVTAYEGSVKGLVIALNADLYSAKKKKEWHNCWVTFLGEDGNRKGIFYIPSDVKDIAIAELLSQAWDAPSFDYELYLEAFHLMKAGDDKILMGLILVIFGHKEELIPFLKKSAKKAGQLLLEYGDLSFFKAFLDLDILSKPSTSALLEECNAKDNPSFAAYLMDYREKHVKTRSFSRFDL